MRLVKQEHLSGCAIACVASILGLSYEKTIGSFRKGEERARLRGFYCPEIIYALNKNGLKYHSIYIKNKKYKYPVGAIVYLEKSKRYPLGHFMCKTSKGWMDSWINFPSLKVKAAFRTRLPGKSVYAVRPQ